MAEKKKNLSQYQQLKQKRIKGLTQEFDAFIAHLKTLAVIKTTSVCQRQANKSGEYDQIDQKVCIRDRSRKTQNALVQSLPDLTQQAINYQQCMIQCERNSISYVVANQSCQGVYQKNFNKAKENIIERLKKEEIL